MSKHSTATRRMFLKCGALLAGPIAAGPVSAAALARDRPEEGLNARVRHLEDEAAIRELHQSWLRRINVGQGMALSEESLRRVSADPLGGADRVEIAADGRGATGRFDCTVELDTRLAEDCTLGQMAHAQGTGLVRTRERRLLTVEYLKVADTWTIGKIAFHAR